MCRHVSSAGSAQMIRTTQLTTLYMVPTEIYIISAGFLFLKMLKRRGDMLKSRGPRDFIVSTHAPLTFHLLWRTVLTVMVSVSINGETSSLLTGQVERPF